MSIIKWWIQKNLIDDRTLNSIINSLTDQYIEFELVYIIPFSDEIQLDIDHDRMNYFYGTTSFIYNAYNSMFKNCVFFDELKFSMGVYLEKWGDKMLNYDMEIVTVKDFIQSNRPNEEVFIRPDDDSKAFSGCVTTIDEFKNVIKNILNYNKYFDTTTKLSIAKPKVIEKEWRNFVVNKKVVSSSRYCEFGVKSTSNIDVPDDMINFVENCCNIYTPNDIFVMDVAFLNGQYYIIECNCFNDTGFYENDVDSVFRSINKFLKDSY